MASSMAANGSLSVSGADPVICGCREDVKLDAA
jgi:hypothetical protein